MKLFMIADDFTGSNDTGVQFSKKGFKTVVSMYSENMTADRDNIDVLVVDSESRFDNSERAYEKIRNIVDSFYSKDLLIYKKLDSTLRGNIGAEIEAAMDASETNLCIMTPAFPNNGRTVENGVLMVNNVPLSDTEVAKDPKNPVTCSYIPDLLKKQTRKQIALIGFDEVLKGSSYVEAKIEKLYDEGNEIVVIDARNNNELNIIAEAAAKVSRKFILSGSAGLAEFVPQNFYPEASAYKNTSKVLTASDGKIIVLAGSVSDVLRKQVEVAEESESFSIIDLDIKKVIFGEWNEEKKRINGEINKLLLQNKDIIIRSAKDRDEVAYAKELGNKEGLNNYDVSERIACFYGELAKLITKELELRLLVMSGGDIAIKAVNAIGVSGIEITEEILPGIPFGYFIGNDNSRIPVVTKAGSFGKEDAIIKVADYFNNLTE